MRSKFQFEIWVLLIQIKHQTWCKTSHKCHHGTKSAGKQYYDRQLPQPQSNCPQKLKNEIAYTPDLKVVGMTMVLMKLLIILLIEKRMENMKNLKNHSTQLSIELYMHLDQKGW